MTAPLSTTHLKITRLLDGEQDDRQLRGRGLGGGGKSKKEKGLLDMDCSVVVVGG